MAFDRLDKVQIFPQEFALHGRFQKINRKRITLRNESDIDVAFKVSDSLPGHIALVPDRGLIMPNSKAVIMVTVSPLEKGEMPEEEDITLLLCPARKDKGNQFWSDNDKWPEISRSKKINLSFKEDDEESTLSTSEESEEKEKMKMDEDEDEGEDTEDDETGESESGSKITTSSDSEREDEKGESESGSKVTTSTEGKSESGSKITTSTEGESESGSKISTSVDSGKASSVETSSKKKSSADSSSSSS